MSPLSTLPATGINIKSPIARTAESFSVQRIHEDMTEAQENALPGKAVDSDETATATVKISNLQQPSFTKEAFSESSIMNLQSKNMKELSRQSLDDATEPNAMDMSMAESNGFDPDNTCLSTFSAVANVDMTAFARLGRTTNGMGTPGRDNLQSSRPGTPGTAMPRRTQSPVKTPNRSPTRLREERTTQLLDFTDQMNLPITSTSRQNSPARARGDLLAGTANRLRSPEGRPLNLLDFDLPPAPTPRSIPTISARELESLKAGFLSEISSLKAKLSGSQAEISSLKEAKDDAERRVGSLSEELRDVKGAKTALQQEKEDWQKHDAERRAALAKLKEEYVAHEEEISRLREEAEEQNKRYQDMENRAGDFEGRLQEAEGKLAGYRVEASNGDGTKPTTPGSNSAVEAAVEKVARELHLLYKSKHEQKVAALKQSYEKRWKKKVDELQFKVEELEKENDILRTGGLTLHGNASSPRSVRNQTKTDESIARVQTLTEEADGLRREIEELNKRMESMSRGVTMLERDNVSLRSELKDSRKENSELVAVVDEMLAIDLSAPDVASGSRPISQSSDAIESAPIAKNPPTSSKIGTGLRGPGFGGGYGESRIGGGLGLKRNPSGSGPRSGIMSNIERMGRGIGGRGGQE